MKRGCDRMDRHAITIRQRNCAEKIFFFFNDTPTPEIYTLSLHDALPISPASSLKSSRRCSAWATRTSTRSVRKSAPMRSEEHTSELQSPCNLVCRLLLEKKFIYSSLVDVSRDAQPACAAVFRRAAARILL